MPDTHTDTQLSNLNINTLTQAQYDAAVSAGIIGANDLSIITDVDYQEKTKITTVDNATATIVLTDNTIFNCTTSLTSLAFTLPTEDSVDFSCQVNFTSGSTATTAPTTTSGTIEWIGDNVNESNGFVPRANCKYTIVFYYDGTNYRGVVQGISL